MPVQKATGGLMAKYGNRLNAAVAAHADDDIDYGFQRLPGGITNGIARLTKCGFGQVGAGKTNEGEYYFQATGVVISPKSVVTPDGDIPVKGGHTTYFEMVCDTKKGNGDVVSQEEHIASVMNEMRKLGANTAGMTAADLEVIAAALEESKPYFKFSTNETPAQLNPDGTVKYKARVWERWHGNQGLEDYVEPDDGTAPVDNSEPVTPVAAPKPAPVTKTAVPPKATPAPAAKPAPSTTKPTPVAKTAPAAKAKPPEPEPEPVAPDEIDGGDLDSLAAKADKGDKKAQATLTTMAEKAGVDDAAFGAADSYAAVVELIKGNALTTEDEPAGDDDGWKPEVGGAYDYKPVDKKTGAKAKKAVEIAIDAIDEDAKTFDAHSLDNPKTKFTKVPWDALRE